MKHLNLLTLIHLQRHLNLKILLHPQKHLHQQLPLQKKPTITSTETPTVEVYSLNDYLSLITEDDKEFLRRHVIIKGDTSRPVVMLTYDDGGREENIRQILEVLNLYNAKATFFITEEWLERYPDIVREIVAKGLDLGCHGWNHDELTSLGRQGVYEQLRHFLEVSWAILPGYQVRFFRPPYGSRNDMVVDVASCFGMQTVIWSLESGGLDGVEKTVSRVVKGARNGDIVLSHSTRYYDVLAVEKIIKGLIERGLNPVGMKEGINFKDLWVPSWEINVSLPN